MVSAILAEVWKSRENSAICMTTEDMIAVMDRVNQDQENDSLIIGSTNLVALYKALIYNSQLIRCVKSSLKVTSVFEVPMVWSWACTYH